MVGTGWSGPGWYGGINKLGGQFALLADNPRALRDALTAWGPCDTLSEAQKRPTLREYIDRMPTGPGTCPVDGCGLSLVCIVAEPWGGTGPIAPPRFACPDHDAWIGMCLDSTPGAEFYSAVLKHPDDPFWAWIPPAMRWPFIMAGFGLVGHDPLTWPTKRIGAYQGRTWFTDCKTMIAIGSENWFNHVAASRELSSREKLRDSQVATMFNLLDDSCQQVSVGKPSEVGRSERWDEGRAIGRAVVPKGIVDLLEQIHPGACWYAKPDPKFPVFLKSGDAIVAITMPVDCDEVERRERGEVCPAKHESVSRGGQVIRNYACTMRPGHDGTVHRYFGLDGRLRHSWDESEFQRTDLEAVPENDGRLDCAETDPYHAVVVE